MRKKITKQQLKYLSDDLREIIKDYMKQHDFPARRVTAIKLRVGTVQLPLLAGGD